ncbi:MAG: hypothetical protein OHK0023_03020 [Anaerolineae bacterium]
MYRRVLASLSLMFALLALTACDSRDSIATVTARAEGTQRVASTLTAVSASTATRTPTMTLTPSATAPTTPTESATATPEITEAPTTAPTPSAPASGAQIDGLRGTANRDTVARNAPILNAAEVGQLANGTAVTAVGRNRRFTQIVWENSTAWVLTAHLTFPQGDPNALPQVEATALPPAALPLEFDPLPERDPNTAWFGETVLYSLFVRSFRDSDGDGIGDLRGVIEGLDYLQALGVDGLWLLPVFVSPSYHGYDTIDYYQVNPDYGTNDDLLALIQAVKQRGMYILLDYVANHTSNEHPFFKDALGRPESAYAEYFIWNNDAHTRYAGFAGLGFMPELNYDSPKVREYMIGVALHWLDPNGDGDPSDGIDGWRCDVAKDVPLAFWAELRAAAMKVNPKAIFLGEVWDDGSTIASFLKGDGLNAAFNFPAYRAMGGHHDVNGDGMASGMVSTGQVRAAIRSLRVLASPQTFIVDFSHNHDTNRMMSEVLEDANRAKAAAVWLLTTPNVPVLYYGEEIGMKGSKGAGNPYYDEFRREPFDWYAAESGAGMTTWFKPSNRNNAPNDGISVEEQEGDPNSMLSLYRGLLNLRHDNAALRSGNYAFIRDVEDLYGLVRWSDEALVLVAINFSTTAQQITPANYLSVDGKDYDGGQISVLFNQQADLGTNGVLSIAPGGFAVIQFPRK